MSGTHGLLQPNQPGYYYITLEEGYVTLFKINANKWFEEHKNEEDAEKKRDARSAHAVAKAYITDVLENLSKDLYKQTESEQNLWVFLSFPQLESRLHGGVKMRTLKDAMKEMIEDGYVFKRPNRDPRYKSLEYRLNLPKYRKELIELPTKDVSANLHDEIDSADMHDLSANLHDDDAKMHDASADSHARKNEDSTKTKQREGTKGNDNAITSNVPLSSLPSSIQSPSQEKELSTTNVQNHVSNVDKPIVHVAKETTRSGPITEPLDPSKLVETLTSEEKRIFGLLCEVFYAIPPEVITPKIRKQCAALAPHVRNAEDLKSLKDYTRTEIMNDSAYKKKQAHLGNLVSFVNGWKQEQEHKKKLAEPAKQKQSSQIEEFKAIRNRVLAEAQAGGK